MPLHFTELLENQYFTFTVAKSLQAVTVPILPKLLKVALTSGAGL